MVKIKVDSSIFPMIHTKVLLTLVYMYVSLTSFQSVQSVRIAFLNLPLSYRKSEIVVTRWCERCVAS